MIDLTPIINAIIALLASIITIKVIPWIKAKTTNEQQVMLEAAVRTAVFAAEQIYGAGLGYEKMQYVSEKLREKGFTFSVDDIEAAVYNYINGNKAATPEKSAEVE